MSGGGTNGGAKSSGPGRDADPIAVLAQLASGEEPYTVVHQHGGRTRLRPLAQAKGKQRYRLAGGEVVARPTARFAIVGDANGVALVSCFAGRVEVRARHQQLSLEPHQAAVIQPNGDVEQFASLAAVQLGAERSMEIRELVEAATRALVEAPASPTTAAEPVAPQSTESESEKTTALVTAAAAAAPEIALPDASIGAEDGAEIVDDDEATDTEPFPDDRQGTGRWILAALGVAALIALVLLAVLPDDDDDDGGAVAGPVTTLEQTTTTAAPAGATTVPDTTATSAQAETTTTEPPATTTTIAPPTASIQPKSCVQQGTTITYTAGLTNTSETRATYDIRVAFIDQTGSEVGSATATVADVAPGSSKDWSATGSVPADLRDTGASCAVTSISGRAA